MRILIDMQGMQGVSQNRGIGRYTQSFVHALISIAQKHDIYFLLNGLYPGTAKQIQKAFLASLPKTRFLVFDALGPVQESDAENGQNARISELIREKLIKDIAPDFLIVTSLFEGMGNDSVTSIAAYTKQIPTAVIFYDLIPYIHEDVYLNTPQRTEWYMRKFNALKQADGLLCISFSAQNEAVLYLDRESSDIAVISSAADKTFYSEKYDPEMLHHYGIERPYIMHASAYEERKNFEGLIEAFGLLPKSLRQKYQLVLVCVLTDKQKNNLLEAAANARLEKDELVLTGYIPDDDLIALYTKAELFVFPSKHEGFGLPPLEAMSCGTATIGSDCSSIPEVIGRSDALFDPLDTESMSEKIIEVLTNDDFRHSLEAHALLQAQKFSWEITAQKTLSFLEEKHRKNPPVKREISLHRSTAHLIETIGSQGLLDSLSETRLHRIALAIERNEKTVVSLMADNYYDKPLCWRVEGPFDSTYSLAMINREVALALEEKGYDVVLHSTEGPGDFLPDNVFLSQHPKVDKLYQKSIGHSEVQANVCSRNLYPPRVRDMKSSINLLHNYAWEETVFPPEWIEDFNVSLEGIVCTSRHVEKIMTDNGAVVPLAISGNGVDHWEHIESDKTYRPDTHHTFRFLHVSSCFPRKGADVMLKSYGDAFCAKDDVILIIKTFPNPHNEIHGWLEEARKHNPEYPDVLIIEEDLTDAQLKSLYEQCHALVAPSRAEGFGLPMAEAMLSSLPVITTGWSGQLDFCSDETSWLVDFSFTPAQTHFNLYNSVWAEPSRNDLSRVMQEVYSLPESLRKQKSEYGRKMLLEKFAWSETTQHLSDFVKTLPTEEILFEKPKIGWVTSWNTKCGIASYSRHLIDAFGEEVMILASHADHPVTADGINVYRCWQAGEDDLEELYRTIERLKLDTVVIQFNYGFFNFDHFSHLLDALKEKGKSVVVMLHATTDPVQAPHKKLSMLVPSMQSCSRLLVHTIDDLNRMKSLGLLGNVSLFPHGVLDWNPGSAKKESLFTLATYGFFLPHKGLLEIIAALELLLKRGVSVKLKMVNARYPVPESAEMIQQAKEQIKKEGMEKNIEMITDFLPDEESLKHLSTADLIVFPYQETGESSSASVRYGLATGIPVAVTPLKIFEDVGDAVYRLSGCSPEDMTQSIAKIVKQIQERSETARQKQKRASAWVNAHRYPMLGKRLCNMLTALHRKKSQWLSV